jgi:hypothetical protein
MRTHQWQSCKRKTSHLACTVQWEPYYCSGSDTQISRCDKGWRQCSTPKVCACAVSPLVSTPVAAGLVKCSSSSTNCAQAVFCSVPILAARHSQRDAKPSHWIIWRASTSEHVCRNVWLVRIRTGQVANLSELALNKTTDDNFVKLSHLFWSCCAHFETVWPH